MCPLSLPVFALHTLLCDKRMNTLSYVLTLYRRLTWKPLLLYQSTENYLIEYKFLCVQQLSLVSVFTSLLCLQLDTLVALPEKQDI